MAAEEVDADRPALGILEPDNGGLPLPRLTVRCRDDSVEGSLSLSTLGAFRNWPGPLADGPVFKATPPPPPSEGFGAFLIEDGGGTLSAAFLIPFARTGFSAFG